LRLVGARASNALDYPADFMMQFSTFHIDGPILIQGNKHRDLRGSFCETWRLDAFKAAGIALDWQQDNQSHSILAGTVRGLHWQIGSNAQAKLVRPVQGRIFDVAVDLRRSSPFFGQSVSVTLDGDANEQFYVPIGFAHGFCTLDAHTIVTYKTSKPYVPKAERSLAWNDPRIGIDWPQFANGHALSHKDEHAPLFETLSAGDLVFS
jgi:dTDP-4-dehydrorhamnose 3,5-epimerase